MPGYPLFLAISFTIFKSWWVILFIQHIMSGLSAVLLYLIAKKWFSSKLAVIIALIWAFEPYAIDISSQFLTETLYTFLLLFLVFVFLRCKEHFDKTSFILFTSSTLALLIYIKPVSFLLPVVFAITLIYQQKKSHLKALISKDTLIQISSLFIIIFLLLSPWLYRNYSIFGKWQLSSDNASSLYITTLLFEADKEGLRHKPDVPEESEFPRFIESGNLSKTQLQIKSAVDVILTEPILFGKFYFRNLIVGTTSSSWWGSIRNLIKGTSGQVNYHKEVKNAILELNIKKISNFPSKELVSAIIMISGTIFWAVTLLFSILGAIILFKKSDTNTRPHIILITGIILYLLLIGNMAAGDMVRYRFSASPFIIMLAISGLFALTKKIRT